jgi:hypothetical protein
MKSKILSTILLIVLSSASYELISQRSSSYSRYGIGDVDYSYSVRRMGMGQLGTSVADADFIGIINPASIYRLDRTRFEFSVNSEVTYISNSQKEDEFDDANFSGFTFGFPVDFRNGIALAVGLVPFSTVSYEILETYYPENSTFGDFTVDYTGKGGLSKAFIGSSFLLPMDLAIGASFDYYFGSTSYRAHVDFVNSFLFESEYEVSHKNSGIGSTLGLISPDFSRLLSLRSISDFRLGFSVNLFSNLRDDTLLTSRSLLGVTTLDGGKGEISIPNKYSLGVSFILNYKYLFSFDYSSQAWSNYLVNNVSTYPLQDAYKISGGFEYRPGREMGSSFWEQIILRAGLSYEQTQYIFNDIGINQYSVSLGASLPLGIENTIDFAFMYARRGTKESNLHQEDIIKLGMGLSLGELWFLRQEK